MNKEYSIGIYIRLSMADEDTGYRRIVKAMNLPQKEKRPQPP